MARDVRFAEFNVMNMTGLEVIQWKKNPWLKVVLKTNKLIFYASD